MLGGEGAKDPTIWDWLGIFLPKVLGERGLVLRGQK